MDLVADRLRCGVCVLWYGVTVRVCGAVDSTPKGGARQHALRKRACEATAAKRVPPAPERVAATADGGEGAAGGSQGPSPSPL